MGPKLIGSIRLLARTSAALVLLVGPVASRSVVFAQGAPDAGYAPASPQAKAQITRSDDHYSLATDHADVQSVIKTLFDQAKLQFTLDSSVAGQVTLRITGQSLTTALDAICQQAFLRYVIDKQTGIYRFQRDDSAVAASFARLNALNAQLRQQLRALGLALPEDGVLNEALGLQLRDHGAAGPQGPSGQLGYAGPQGRPGSPGGPGGGGFGGAVPSQTSSRAAFRATAGEQGADAKAPSGAAGLDRNQAARPGTPPADGADARRFAMAQANSGVVMNNAATVLNGLANAPMAVGGNTAGGLANNRAAGYTSINQNYAFAGTASQAVANGLVISPSNYPFFISQNNLVTMHVPQAEPVPVVDALQQLGRQVNVPVLVDPGVPQSLKFRIWGNISPRPLPEALNILTPSARLEWRWIGNTIFVTPTPDFQIFYGDSSAPRAVFPPTYEGAAQGTVASPAPSTDAPIAPDRSRGGGQK